MLADLMMNCVAAAADDDDDDAGSLQ